MTKQGFIEKVKENILDYLPKNLREGAEVSVDEITKNNDTVLTSLLIQKKEDVIVPNIYIDNYYRANMQPSEMEGVYKSIAANYLEAKAHTPKGFEMSFDYESIKDKVALQVIGMKENKERLKKLVYKPIGNGLALTYAVTVKSDEMGEGRIHISRAMAQNNNYDLAVLHNDALSNMVKNCPASFINMEDAVLGRTRESELLVDQKPFENGEAPMCVLSNTDFINGATSMFYPGVQEKIADIVGGSYYAIPSSVHEWIIIPKEAGHEPEKLEGMIKGANETEVASDEVLSDKLFMFDKDTKEFGLALPNERELGDRVSERG